MPYILLTGLINAFKPAKHRCVCGVPAVALPGWGRGHPCARASLFAATPEPRGVQLTTQTDELCMCTLRCCGCSRCWAMLSSTRQPYACSLEQFYTRVPMAHTVSVLFVCIQIRSIYIFIYVSIHPPIYLLSILSISCSTILQMQLVATFREDVCAVHMPCVSVYGPRTCSSAE